MERLGFEVKFYPPSPDDHKGLLQQSSGLPDSRDSGSPDTLQVSHSTSGWKLKNEDQSLELQTLEELVRVIKKITLRQLS
jgi:hypothetical protein